MTPAPLCPVCDSASEEFDEAVLLGRHRSVYRRCTGCRLIFLPSPHWLEEAYADGISVDDVGLLRRCRILSGVTSILIRAEGLSHGTFMDWAGGYGTLTRMMRDKGFAFWHDDPYCANLFARDFVDPGDIRYDMITGFEVVEHLTDPRNELAEISRRTDRVFFTTRLLPEPAPRVQDWWYYYVESGQHVMFHTRDSLQVLADVLGFALTSNGENLHLLHRTRPRAGSRALLSEPLAKAKSAGITVVRRARGA